MEDKLKVSPYPTTEHMPTFGCMIRFDKLSDMWLCENRAVINLHSEDILGSSGALS